MLIDVNGNQITYLSENNFDHLSGELSGITFTAALKDDLQQLKQVIKQKGLAGKSFYTHRKHHHNYNRYTCLKIKSAITNIDSVTIVDYPSKDAMLTCNDNM